MAQQTWYTKQGDAGRTVGGANGVKLSGSNSLTGATVRFTMKLPGGAVKINRQTATVLDATNRRVTYALQTADVDLSGATVAADGTVTYYGEWEVTYGSGVIETHPNRVGNEFVIVFQQQLA